MKNVVSAQNRPHVVIPKSSDAITISASGVANTAVVARLERAGAKVVMGTIEGEPLEQARPMVDRRFAASSLLDALPRAGEGLTLDNTRNLTPPGWFCPLHQRKADNALREAIAALSVNVRMELTSESDRGNLRLLRNLETKLNAIFTTGALLSRNNPLLQQLTDAMNSFLRRHEHIPLKLHATWWSEKTQTIQNLLEDLAVALARLGNSGNPAEVTTTPEAYSKDPTVWIKFSTPNR